MKIQKIVLNNFRGFPGPLDYEFKLDGKNLLLYGENGSGKSSLYRALVELFQPEWFPLLKLPLRFPLTLGEYRSFSSFRNIFTQDTATRQPLQTGKVQVAFDRPGMIAEWSETLSRTPLEESAPVELNLTARSMACLDYRAMLETNFVHRHEKINLFSLIVERLLIHTPIVAMNRHTQTLGRTWKYVLSLKPNNHRGTRWKGNLASAVSFWNSTLPPLISQLTQRANQLIASFDGSGIEVTLTPGTLVYSEASRKLEGQEIWLDVKLHGKAVEVPQQFLNEARLSALALSLFLAGYDLSVPKPNPGEPDRARVLVLDDILIGLDMDNRIPILDILRNNFKDWQILLLTHDRPWFEIAKQHLRHSAEWGALETYSRCIQDCEQPIILDDSDLLMRALEYYEAGHVKSAAVYAREQFEHTLKWACETFSVPVPFHQSFRNVKANDLWMALVGKERDVFVPAEFRVTPSGKTIRLPVRHRKERVVPTDLTGRVQRSLSWVLNPLSHSEPINRYGKEIKDAIFSVDELERVVRKSAMDEHHDLILLRRILIGLIGNNPKVTNAPTAIAEESQDVDDGEDSLR